MLELNYIQSQGEEKCVRNGKFSETEATFWIKIKSFLYGGDISGVYHFEQPKNGVSFCYSVNPVIFHL